MPPLEGRVGTDSADVCLVLEGTYPYVSGGVSAWVHDLPWPDRLSYEECRKRAAEGVRRYWEAERPLREARREATRAAAAAEIGTLTQRELLIPAPSLTGVRAPRASRIVAARRWSSSTVIPE